VAEPHLFVALYAGQSIGSAVIVGASIDPELVALAADRMLHSSTEHFPADPVDDLPKRGHRRTLQIIKGGAHE
jgi:hypothetical protein